MGDHDWKYGSNNRNVASMTGIEAWWPESDPRGRNITLMAGFLSVMTGLLSLITGLINTMTGITLRMTGK